MIFEEYVVRVKGFGYGVVVLAAATFVAPLTPARAAVLDDARTDSSAFAPQHGGPAHGSQSYLGVDLKDVSDDQVAALKLKDTRGAEITRVDHDGPAGKMGLREHDVVIQMNGIAIEGEEHIRRMLSATPPGHTIVLLISRDGQQLTMTAQMADRSVVERQAWEQHLGAVGGGAPPPQAPATAFPSDEASAAGSVAPSGGASASRYGKSFIGSLLSSPTYTGVMLERLGPQLATFFGVANGTGLLVRNVETNSPAAMAGLRAGDIVLRADSKNVGSMNDWARAVKEAKGRPVSVVVLRDRQQITMVLTPDTKKRSDVVYPFNPNDEVRIARLTIY
jgi:S1-C subfamily serine protease